MFDARALLNQMLGAGSRATQPGGALSQAGGLLGGLLNQSVAGLQQGASDIEKATGVGAKTGDALKGATGRSPDDLVAMAKDFVSKNQLATGAAAGGIGALLLGTKGGRNALGGAALLGGLAMIGGLAYNALKSRSASQQPQGALPAPPAGSGFGASGDVGRDNSLAILLIKAMVAAAASDGSVDADERAKIIGGLERAGLDRAAGQFLDEQIAHPPSIAELAIAAPTTELALQVYAAARIAIDPDLPIERAFLSDLAEALKLQSADVASIDTAAGKRFA